MLFASTSKRIIKGVVTVFLDWSMAGNPRRQTCVGANRSLVQNGAYDAFIKRLAETAGAMKVADGFEPGAAIGPLRVDRHHRVPEPPYWGVVLDPAVAGSAGALTS